MQAEFVRINQQVAGGDFISFKRRCFGLQVNLARPIKQSKCRIRLQILFKRKSDNFDIDSGDADQGGPFNAGHQGGVTAIVIRCCLKVSLDHCQGKAAAVYGKAGAAGSAYEEISNLQVDRQQAGVIHIDRSIAINIHINLLPYQFEIGFRLQVTKTIERQYAADGGNLRLKTGTDHLDDDTLAVFELNGIAGKGFTIR